MNDFDLEEFVNPCIIDKLTEVYEKDETYQELLKAQDLLYEKLEEKLSDELADELEEYFEATVETSARKEKLTYLQGMKDMYNTSLILQDKEKK